MVTTCCAAVVTQGRVGIVDTSSTQPPAPHPVSHCCSCAQGAQTCLLPPPQLLALLACCLSPCPSLCPHRHHVVLQLLQPCAALVTATASCGQAVVGTVEGGRGGATVIRFKGLVGAIAVGRHRPVGPCTPPVPICPPLTAQHPPAGRAGASLQWGLAPTQGQGHPPRVRGIPHRFSGTHPSPRAPWGTQTHKELQQL